FFQAGDGIRGFHVTGVQTCALPISIKVLVDLINQHLLNAHARGRNTVVIIDEAQNLSTEVLEQLRLLTNLETSEKKLLQIVLLRSEERRGGKEGRCRRWVCVSTHET